MKKIKLLLSLLLFNTLYSQDIKCNLTVNSTQIEGSENIVFKTLEQSLNQFINNRKWANETIKEVEKIKLNILINLTERVSPTSYKGFIQVQSLRPVFNSNYNTTIFNHQDKDFEFSYTQFDLLDFSEQTNISELTSIIVYYIYITLGLDYDSFLRLGGTVYFQKAQNIVNQNQSSSFAGWKAFDSQYNRYWLVTNILNQLFNELRECMYEYHRLGLDKMSENVELGRKNIINALKKLNKIHQRNPNSYNLRVFFNAKSDEIVKIMKKASTTDKTEISKLLQNINPDNNNKWRKIK